MKDITIFILACYGMTGIICYSTILKPLRERGSGFKRRDDPPREDGIGLFEKYRKPFFSELLSCPMCAGFWVGFLLNGLLPIEHWGARMMAAPLISSGTSYFLCMIVGDHGIRIKK